MYDLVKKYKELLNKHNITQTELARKTKTDIDTLKKFVSNGTIKIPILQKIADYFNIPITYFFVEKESELYMEFLHKFKNLNESKQNHIVEMMDSLKNVK